MVLEDYDSREAMRFRGQNALDVMISNLRLVNERVQKISSGHNYKGYFLDILGACKDYMHFRDVAVKYGADVSQLPKTIKIPQESGIRNMIEELKLKQKLK